MKKNLKSIPDSGVGTRAKKRYLEEIASLKAENGLYNTLTEDEDDEDIKNIQTTAVKHKKRSIEVNTDKIQFSYNLQ